MTRYKKIQQKARDAGIDTIQDNHGSPKGYWITKKNGDPLWEDGNFTTQLDELESMVQEYRATAQKLTEQNK